MADETATTSDNTTVTNDQTVQTTQTTSTTNTSNVADTESATDTPKAGTPSPAALANKTSHIPAAATNTTYSADALKAAEAFGHVDEKGTVFVRDGEQEREVGQFPDAANTEEALELYARRYLDLQDKLNLFATRLKASNIKSREIDESLKSLEEETKEPAVVGDIPALRKQLEELKNEGEQKKTQLSEERKAALAKALEERNKIVEKAESLVANMGDQTNWKETADKFKDLFEQWQNHQRTSIRIDKKHADDLWKRFSSARSNFNQARRKWAQKRDETRNQARQIKQAIIKRANDLKDSTDWADTSHAFNNMMNEWKQAGRVGRTEDEKLWGQFREAADVFFNARQADRDKTSLTEQENLKLKEELLVKAEALVPVNDEASAKKARQALAKIQEQWDQIGYVPRADMHRIENRLDAVDKQIKAVEDAAWKKSDPEADARKTSFEQQLESQLNDLNERIAKESNADKKRELEAEKATKEQWLKAVQK